jgi:hypothetical protein
MQTKGGKNMQIKLGGLFTLFVCVVAAVTLTAPAWAGGEVYVVGAEADGDANYMASNGDGSFKSLEILQLTAESGMTAYPLSYGNGIGDFNNDGNYDYITGLGYGGGDIYIFENLGAENQFASPVNAASWNEGYYPMDLAVADFDGDGNQDFVMSLMYSATSGLYLGNGKLGFTYSALATTAPSYSAGVDAADFNNDGFADFVVAPNSYEPIYVNLGKGDGTFYDSLTFNTYDGNAVYGIAAADFDNDGNTDIATAYHDSLIIYTGNGDGTFQWLASYDFALNQSAIDNYDFDGDGNQDLVAANFDSTSDGIAVLLGNGDGTFTYDAIYSGGSGGDLNALSGPPYEPESNIEPVAILDPTIYEVTVGQAVDFDGSQSYDEDGEIIAYQWDFGDEVQAVAAMQMVEVAGFDAGTDRQTHAYNEVGLFFATLTVTDDKGSTASVQAEVRVNEAAVPVTIWFNPGKLDLNKSGKWITATIKVPAGYDARNIEGASVQIAMDGGPAVSAHTNSKYGFVKKFFRRHAHKHLLTVKFDRQAVIDLLAGTSGKTDLKLEGKILHDGQLLNISGSGSIKVFEKKNKRVKHYWKFWRR